MWNRPTVSGDPVQVLIDQVIGVQVGVTAAVHLPDEQMCRRGASIFMLRSVLTPHWVVPQCQQTDGGGGDWSHTKEDAVLERPQLDPFHQRGYKRHRSIWGHSVPIQTGDKLWWKYLNKLAKKHIKCRCFHTGHEKLLFNKEENNDP